MFRKLTSFFSVCIFLNVLIACASIAPDFPSALKSRPEITAIAMPEIVLHTTDGRTIQGKIQALEGNYVKVLPNPYWNADPIFLNLNDLSGIESQPKKGAVGKGFLWGFSAPFLIIGILGVATSEYNDDFSMALAAGAVVGLVGGIIGVLISAASAKQYNFQFEGLTPEKKKGAITKIMGY